jgi:hypothetical protein
VGFEAGQRVDVQMNRSQESAADLPARLVALREEYRWPSGPATQPWFSLAAGSRLPCVTAIRFVPPLPAGVRAELRAGRAIVALEDAFSLPQALEPRSRPARHVGALAPERVGAFLDNADPAHPLHVRVVGEAEGAASDPPSPSARQISHPPSPSARQISQPAGRLLVVEGLNVVVAEVGEDGGDGGEPAYADRH